MVARPEVTLQGPVADLYRMIAEGRFRELPKEVCFWGGAGTAKSFQVMTILVLLLNSSEVGGARVLWTRKYRADITQSSLVTYGKVRAHLGLSPVTGAQKSNRGAEVFQTATGTNELVWCGLDDPGKAFSAEYDIVVYEEALFISEAVYEDVGIRALRNFCLPFQLQIVMTNPGPRNHWIRRRMKRGDLVGFETFRSDNPAYYDQARQEWTEEGLEYEERLSRYTGVRRKRMKDGQWVSDEGWALEGWTDHEHIFHGEVVFQEHQPPRLRLTRPHPHIENGTKLVGFFGSFDWGFTNPSSFIVWGVDEAGKLYGVAEWYHSERDRDWWAEKFIDAFERFDLTSIVCDHERERIQFWNKELSKRAKVRAGIDGKPFVRKAVKNSGNKQDFNLEVVRAAIAKQEDDKPGLYVRSSMLQHNPDPLLVEKDHPVRLEDEFLQIVMKPLDPKDEGEKKRPEVLHPGRADHAFDSTAYALRHARNHTPEYGWTRRVIHPKPDEIEWHERHVERLERKRA